MAEILPLAEGRKRLKSLDEFVAPAWRGERRGRRGWRLGFASLTGLALAAGAVLGLWFG